MLLPVEEGRSLQQQEREKFRSLLPAGDLGQIGDDRLDEMLSELERLITERPHDRYYLKAMNCPHHHKLFGAVPRSYRDLPLRLAEYGTCYRYEQSGELFGLMRVRSMQMNDAHIYCTEDQFEEEFRAVGVPFADRAARTAEAVRALRSLWGEQPSSFSGKFFRWEPLHSTPRPVQKGGVPVVVGGHTDIAAKRAAIHCR